MQRRENGLQFRDAVSKSPDKCFFTSKQQEDKVRGCQVSHNCSNVFYSNWGVCASGLQTRTIISQVPDKCVVTAHQQLFTTKTCSAVLAVKKYPDGSLLSDSKNIYFIVSGKKYRLKNVKELWTYRKIKTIKVSLDILSQYPDTSSPTVK